MLIRQDPLALQQLGNFYYIFNNIEIFKEKSSLLDLFYLIPVDPRVFFMSE